MKLIIDGRPIEINEGESIHSAVVRLGLESEKLSERPLAARIGGDIFNLGYTPYKDAEITLLRYGEDAGRRVYEYTAQFVLLLAVRHLFPDAEVKVRYALDCGIYITIEKDPALSRQDVRLLEAECKRIAEADLPLKRRRLDIEDALSFFEKEGCEDKVRLLKWRRFSYFDVYTAEDYMEYFYGEMAPSTGYVRAIKLKPLTGALVLLLPRASDPDSISSYHHQPKLAEVFRKSDRWGELMRCDTVAELNEQVASGGIRELIRVNEALHERSYALLADQIVSRKARAVMVAGPSSSGKTTSANRLATQLRTLGQQPIMISLDNYYLDRDEIPLDEKGERDLEHIETLDIKRFNADLASLLRGEETALPCFDFNTGCRSDRCSILRVGKDQPLIIEGIHGLNSRMLSPEIPADAVFRVYVSALTTLNLDDHNRIRTTDVRLLRRLVRDHATRNSSMEETLSMWPSVRRGEEKWIFPFQEQADAIFNTTLVYELAVLKKYVYPLLQEVPRKSPYYLQAKNILKFLNYFLDAEVEDEIPPTSVLREFIGGNAFYRKTEDET